MKVQKALGPILIALFMTSCVQDAQLKTITVKVNMNGVENPSKVGIRGTHTLSWDETNFLNDTDSDGIYEDIFQIYATNNTVEFKFVNNASEFELQDQSNRKLTFEYKPETIVYGAIYNNAKDIIISRK